MEHREKGGPGDTTDRQVLSTQDLDSYPKHQLAPKSSH